MLVRRPRKPPVTRENLRCNIINRPESGRTLATVAWRASPCQAGSTEEVGPTDGLGEAEVVGAGQEAIIVDEGGNVYLCRFKNFQKKLEGVRFF